MQTHDTGAVRFFTGRPRSPRPTWSFRLPGLLAFGSLVAGLLTTSVWAAGVWATEATNAGSIAIGPGASSTAMTSPAAAAVSDDTELESRLALAQDNREEIERAWKAVPSDQAEGMRFLIQHMPASDLRSLSADYLLEHVQIAYQARSEARWGQQIPREIFLNEVLPYANVSESRDDVRRQLRERFWPVVQELDSISEAAARLNHEVFHQTGVKYSTARRRADQGPQETMDSGIASCTGLSILLIHACRACGIPARFVGTPLWSDGSGNHSWVEIWDGQWHFTGAAEPTGQQLNQAWFTGRAAQATPGHPRHGIYAVSFARTDLPFPMVWRRGRAAEIFGVDVTHHYVTDVARPPGHLEIRFRALEAGGRQRCRADLLIRDAMDEVIFRGQTLDEAADTNNHLTALLPPGRYTVQWTTDAGTRQQVFQADQDGQLITLPAPDSETSPADTDDEVLAALQIWLQTEPQERPPLVDQDFARQPLTAQQAHQAQQLLVAEHRQRIAETRAEEHQRRELVIDDLTMRFDLRKFGEAPPAGHSLYISMHGGGNAPSRVNDRQWENQKRLYRLEEGIYLTPRAPTDTWNLWHQAHIDDFFTRLIENLIVLEGIDPDRVYLTGYSAGGDGVYQLAPRLADRLAAAAMMAGHPNETKPDGLRNLAFTLHVGALDNPYNRNEVARQWADQLAELQRQDPDGYVHWAKIHEGKGHWMDGDDAEGVAWMAQHRRNLLPQRIVWLQDDVTHHRFYWLAVGDQDPVQRQRVVASRQGQDFVIESSDPQSLGILLRQDMVDMDQEITVRWDDQVVFQGVVPRTIETLHATLSDRGDPEAMFSGRVVLRRPTAPEPLIPGTGSSQNGQND